MATSEEREALPAEESSRSERRKAQLAQWREKFVQNLESVGLVMEKVLLTRLKIIYLIIKLLNLFIIFPDLLINVFFVASLLVGGNCKWKEDHTLSQN